MRKQLLNFSNLKCLQFLFLNIILLRTTFAIVNKQQTLTNNLFKLLQQLEAERPYSSMLVLGNQHESCHENVLQKNLQKAFLSFNAASETANALYEKFNKDFVCFLCLTQKAALRQINLLAKLLQHIRQTRIIVWLKADFETKNIQQQLIAHKMLNVVLINETRFLAGYYTSLKPFSSVPLEEQQLKHKQLFAATLNLNGKALYTQLDQIVPRSYVYRKRKTGEIKQIGYVAELLKTFAAKYNATLTTRDPVKPGEVIIYAEIEAKTQTGELDIGTTLTVLTSLSNLPWLSYPLEVNNYCTMYPVARVEIYMLPLAIWGMKNIIRWLMLGVLLAFLDAIMRPFSRLNDLMLNDHVLRGILGQAFFTKWRVERHAHLLFHWCLFLIGLAFTTLYNARMQTYLTHLPNKPIPRSFDDWLLMFNTKLLISRREFDLLFWAHGAEFAAYRSIFSIAPTFEHFQRKRTRLERGFAYPFTDLYGKAVSLEKRKNYLNANFVFTCNMKFSDLLFMSIPLAPNSFCREPLNDLIFRLQSAGILQHWLEEAYFEMLFVEEFGLRSWAAAHQERALNLKDLEFFWWAKLILDSLALLLFCLEHCVRQVVLMLRKLKRKKKLAQTFKKASRK